LLEKNAEIKETQFNIVKSEINNQAILILEKNKIISEIREELSTIRDFHNSNLNTEIDIISELLTARILTEENWTDFKQKFKEVYPDFITKTKVKFGKLTDTEIRLACLIKLNISNNDIGSMLGISPESVIKSKYRFKKKINLGEDIQLDDLINEI
jgi:DNA-binding NarL/FixJ family response regulator